jgi:hypothetical protein
MWPFIALALAGFVAIALAVAVSPTLRHAIELLSLRLQDLLGL